MENHKKGVKSDCKFLTSIISESIPCKPFFFRFLKFSGLSDTFSKSSISGLVEYKTSGKVSFYSERILIFWEKNLKQKIEKIDKN